MMDAMMQMRSKSEKITHIFSYQMGLLQYVFVARATQPSQIS